MKKILALATVVALIAGFTMNPAKAEVVTGEMAPAFSVKDINGQDVSLEALKGKIVVLEWTNAECPFVKKHYGSGNMQATQEAAADMGVVWISVNSGAEGKQGHVDVEGAKAVIASDQSHPSHYVIDEKGDLGKLYGAKTTPHMYVIDTEGHLVYQGAIDDNSSADPSVIPESKNYVLAALNEVMQGQPVSSPETQPYGCSVKY